MKYVSIARVREGKSLSDVGETPRESNLSESGVRHCYSHQPGEVATWTSHLAYRPILMACIVCSFVLFLIYISSYTNLFFGISQKKFSKDVGHTCTHGKS